jgi:hypothetical protein
MTPLEIVSTETYTLLSEKAKTAWLVKYVAMIWITEVRYLAGAGTLLFGNIFRLALEPILPHTP